MTESGQNDSIVVMQQQQQHYVSYFYVVLHLLLRGMCTHSHALFARAKKIKPKVIEPPIHVPAILFGTNDDDDDASDRQIFIKLKWNLYATIY